MGAAAVRNNPVQTHIVKSRDPLADPISNHNTTPGGRFKKAYELLNLRAFRFSPVNKMHIFQCMGKYYVWKGPLKFHTKYLTHTLKDAIFIQF